jgi:hypothetical protein
MGGLSRNSFCQHFRVAITQKLFEYILLWWGGSSMNNFTRSERTISWHFLTPEILEPRLAQFCVPHRMLDILVAQVSS